MNDESFDNPYSAPEHLEGAKPERPPGAMPGVWPWFVAYCIIMGLLYLLFMGLGVLYIAIPAEMVDPESPEEILLMRAMGVVFTALGLILSGVCFAAPFLPKRPWAWIYDIILICFGLTSCCTWPLTIPVLIFWIRAETRLYFNMT